MNVDSSVNIGNGHVNAVVSAGSTSISADVDVNNRNVQSDVQRRNSSVEAQAQIRSGNVHTEVNPHMSVVNDHAQLQNLGYDESGHTGFQRELIPDESITIDEEGHIHANGESYTAGQNINIDENNVISAVDTTYTQGDGITIDQDNVISNDIYPLVPAQATINNQLADKDFVNSSIATSTATFRGTYNVVTDLHLSTSATHQQVDTALGNTISVADNNDYCFVEIPTDDLTPTETLQVDRYKYNGSSWSFEYTLNNSGYTSAQWKAINSGITSGKVTQYDDYATSKQDVLTAGTGISIDSDNVISSVPPIWGNITGILSDQTDLQQQLDALWQFHNDLYLPVIYNESISQSTNNSIIFKFYANSVPRLLSAQIEYADNQQLHNSTIINIPNPIVGENSVRIDNLLPQTTYWFKATATNQYGSAETPTMQPYDTGTIEYWIKNNLNLRLWLTPGNVLLDSSNKVQRWYDLSPINYTVQQTTASARPSVNNNGINGYQTLVFNGTSTYLTGGDILDLDITSWTWFIVGKVNANSAWSRPYLSKTRYGSGDNNNRYSLAPSSLVFMPGPSATEYNSSTNNNRLLYWHILTWENNREALKNIFYVNNVYRNYATFPNNNMNSTNHFLIGGYGNQSGTVPQTNFVLNGEIAEIIVFNSNDPNIRTYVTQYLTNKYFPNAYLTVDLGDDVTVPRGTSSYVIDAGAGFESYLWSTGETTQTITVTQSGTYSVTCITNFGVESSDSIDITFE